MLVNTFCQPSFFFPPSIQQDPIWPAEVPPGEIRQGPGRVSSGLARRELRSGAGWSIPTQLAQRSGPHSIRFHIALFFFQRGGEKSWAVQNLVENLRFGNHTKFIFGFCLDLFLNSLKLCPEKHEDASMRGSCCNHVPTFCCMQAFVVCLWNK